MLMNNPAARLHQILALCKKHQKESGSRPMLMGWRKVFRMAESTGDFSVLERIGKVYGLPGEVSDLVRRCDDLDVQLYLGWREELEDAFLHLSFHSEFETFVRRVPKTLLTNLEFCSNALSERYPEPMVDPDKLAEISKEAGEIIQSLPEAEVDASGRRYFLDYLTLIRRAVDDYMLSGAVGLQGAIDACTGTLVTQRGVSLANRESAVGKKFWSLIGKVTKSLAQPESGEEAGADGGRRTMLKAIVRRKAA
jgi:hypothetical protein